MEYTRTDIVKDPRFTRILLVWNAIRKEADMDVVTWHPVPSVLDVVTRPRLIDHVAEYGFAFVEGRLRETLLEVTHVKGSDT